MKYKYLLSISILATLLTTSLHATNNNENVFESPNVPRGKPLGHDRPLLQQQQAPIKIGVNRLTEDINYAYGFEADKANFRPGEFLHTQGVTKGWMVLVNVHTEMPLNTTNVFDPKKRTLKWGSPYENARANFFRIEDPHEQSALLRDWTSGEHRKNVSFVFIPPNSQVEYLIGHASPQQGRQFRSEAGGGMQIRLKNLPAGTIVLDTRLITERQLGKQASQKSFALDRILSHVIDRYNNNLKPNEARIPTRLADPNYYPYDFNDIREVNENHLKL